MLLENSFFNIPMFSSLDLILLSLVISLGLVTIFLNIFILKDKTTISKYTNMLTISITKNGDILFNKKPIQKKYITDELSKYTKDTYIYINCNKQTKFDIFIYLLKTVKEKKFHNLSINPIKS